MIDVIILTYNEEKHIERAIKSFGDLGATFHVIDSFSQDNTVEISRSLGAKVIQRTWPGNHAEQFNFALNTIEFKNEWVMKLDADEYILPDLRDELHLNLKGLDKSISGISLKRRLVFHGKWIRYGGYYPSIQLRIWRKSQAVMQSRIMDEHIQLLSGSVVLLKNDFVDENLNGLSQWIAKHNDYSDKEAAIIIAGEQKKDGIESNVLATKTTLKELLQKVYKMVPAFIRPILYFFWRYIFRLGFLDGLSGLQWHFLQGLWYRFLVDSKVYEYKLGKYDNTKIDILLKKIKNKG